jgi:hypothetical protein
MVPAEDVAESSKASDALEYSPSAMMQRVTRADMDKAAPDASICSAK